MGTTVTNFGAVVSHNITSTLAAGAWYQTNKIDNGVIRAIWAEVFVTLTTDAGVASLPSGTLDVYIAGSVDGGTDYSGGASGGEGVYTPTNGDGYDMQLIGSVPANAQDAFSVTYKKLFIIDNVPEHFKIVVENNTGLPLAAPTGTIEIRLHKYDIS